jgi:hypothetical protein
VSFAPDSGGAGGSFGMRDKDAHDGGGRGGASSCQPTTKKSNRAVSAVAMVTWLLKVKWSERVIR